MEHPARSSAVRLERGGLLRDDFQSALNGEAQQPVPFKVAQRLSGGMSLDAVDGFQDFGENLALGH